MFRLSLSENRDQREKLANGRSIDDFIEVTSTLRDKYENIHNGDGKSWFRNADDDDRESNCNLFLPPWICQPYVRNADDNDNNNSDVVKRTIEEFYDENGKPISKKKFKKLKRFKKRVQIVDEHNKRRSETCKNCPNPLGFKCAFELCKPCCKNQCFLNNTDCVGHRILIKTRREIAQKFGNG